MDSQRPQFEVTHILASLAKESGGPSYSVPALAAALARNGAKVCLRSVSRGASSVRYAEGVNHCEHAPATYYGGVALSASQDMKRALMGDARGGALLHTHGLWLMPNVYPAWAKGKSEQRAKLLHAPRGMLGHEALKISAWKKKPFWLLLQRPALEMADCLHATADSEYEEIRAAGLRNPVAIIKNGVDLPDKLVRSEREAIVLTLGRIHPKKGLDRLIRAWRQLEDQFPHWKLRIIGPAEVGHDEELRDLAKAIGATRVSIEGPMYDGAKWTAYQTARLFVLPTLNENFGMTVAEALAAELPVISTKGAPWCSLEVEHCGWWVDHGVEAIRDALRRAMTIDQDERNVMGARGRAWMARDFGWDRIACDLLDVYRWLKLGGEPPSTVRVN